MDNGAVRQASPNSAGRQRVQSPDEVTTMVHLHQLGWGVRRIAAELGTSRNTVRRYLRGGGWAPYGHPGRRKLLDGLEGWVAEQFRLHRGNAEVVRQELKKQHGVELSLRTVERAVAGPRQHLRSEAAATLRFETPPGKQLQVDFGQMKILIGGEPTKVHLCVLTLGYSRRPYVEPCEHERLSDWLTGLEAGFRHFGGVAEEVLLDNARALVKHHDVASGEVLFSDRFLAFTRYWGFRPRACAPYRARTKGKDESGVGYVKRNAIAGRHFDSWPALRAHLSWWMREVADCRIHGTTGEPPLARFLREEAAALRPLADRSPFVQVRELHRKVHTDLCVEVDTNHYSVPWRLIGEAVTVQVADELLRIFHAGTEVASHPQHAGRRQWVVDKRHYVGLTNLYGPHAQPAEPSRLEPSPLLRPLAEYEAVGGGRW